MNFYNFDNSHNSFLWAEYLIGFLCERWIPCQASTSVLCLHYRPVTVYYSTKDAYTSEITFLALNPWYCQNFQKTGIKVLEKNELINFSPAHRVFNHGTFLFKYDVTSLNKILFYLRQQFSLQQEWKRGTYFAQIIRLQILCKHICKILAWHKY